MNGVWLLSVEALTPSGDPTTLRFSAGESHEGGYAWIPRIKQAGLYRAGLFAGQLLNVSRSGYGETTLINSDGGLNYLVDYAMDGRKAVLSYSEDGVTEEVLVGTVSRITFERNIVSLRLRDPTEVLQNPHPYTRYAGDNVLPNGLEGTDDDIGGNVKPRLYGGVSNASPVMVNSSLLIYQVSDQPCTVTDVYDNGVPLVFDGDYTSLAELEGTLLEPPEGHWRRIDGYIRLGASPVGQITCDATTSYTKAGDVMSAVASDAGFTVEPSDVATLNSVGDVRLWIAQETPTVDLLDSIAVSVGGFWRINSMGIIRTGLLEGPATPSLTLLDHQIIEINRDASGAGQNGLPVGRVTVSSDPIETVQKDLAGAVEESRRARLSQAYRKFEAEDPSVFTRHLLADSIQIDSRLATRAQGQSVANRVLSLLSSRRDSLSITARVLDAPTISIGSTIRVVTPRLGYSEGRNLLLVGREIDTSRNRLLLTLWG